MVVMVAAKNGRPKMYVPRTPRQRTRVHRDRRQELLEKANQEEMERTLTKFEQQSFSVPMYPRKTGGCPKCGHYLSPQLKNHEVTKYTCGNCGVTLYRKRNNGRTT